MPPTMLLSSLENIRRRVRLLSFGYGVGLTLLVVAGAVFALVGLDYVLNLPPLPRLLGALIAIAAIAHILFHHIVRPLLSKLTLGDIASRIETTFPQFDDRLRSTVNFLRGDIPGSETLKQRVLDETGSLAANLDLNRAIVAKPAWYSMFAGFGAMLVLLLIAFLALSPQLRGIAVARLISPFGEHAWPKRVQIDSLGSLPSRVPVGQRIDVRMKLVKGDRASMKAIAFYQYDDGVVQQELMTRGADGTYATSLDARVEAGKTSASLKVWMKAGDDQTAPSSVIVLPRLAIRTIEAIITPPAYVGNRIESNINLAAAPAVMALGSGVTLRVGFSKPLAGDGKIELIASDEKMTPPPVQWTTKGNICEGTLTALQSLRFHVRATDVDGFTNTAIEEYELVVRPDQMPSVQIDAPRRSEDRTAVAAIPMEISADDDYGIAWMKLCVDRIGDKHHWEIPLVTDSQPTPDISWTRVESGVERARFRANYSWDLAQLEKAELKSGDVLEFYVSAADNYLLDGKSHDPVMSGKLRITIISQEDLSNRVVDELRQLKTQINQARASQSRLKEETAELATTSAAKEQLDAIEKSAAERLNKQQSGVLALTKQIATRVESIHQKLEENKSPSAELKQLSKDVTSDLNNAADEAMKDASQQISSAQQPGQKPQARNQNLQRAQESQLQAAEDLQRALDRMADIGSLQQTIEKLAAILAEQKELSKQTAEIGRDKVGKTPDQLKPDDRKKLDDNADAQSKLAERTAKALEQMSKSAEQMQKSDPSSAEAMSKASNTAKQQQVSQKQQDASKQAKQNQTDSARTSQKQAEIGLELILSELRAAEKARLAELSKKLEEIQKQIANLIRRQAGHNLDNLTLQGPERLAKVPADELADLKTKTERDAAALMIEPKLPQLSQSQEQTERNTRDLAKTSEALPDGAEPAVRLSKAASKMERAIFALRDTQLADAYDPSQIEALLALEAAKKVVDDQKDKIDQQIADTEREAIRRRYVKIRDDQVKLNDGTVRVDKSRDQDGNYGFVEGKELVKMPADQGKLADRVSDIDQDLAALGSVVYLWANKDIASAMNDVKTDLAKPQTGAPTQSQQATILEQLDSMIRNLATKPKESKFAQDGGGDCKGGGPKLPTEAELRLLQDLQKVVNKNTKIAEADLKKDEPKLKGLGSRQGELRKLLDELLSKSSNGEIKLGPEPDKLAQLPEEAKVEDVENQELDNDLLEGKPEAKEEEKKALLIGDRMARSRQRLADNHDPGKVTQVIQDRIILDFDRLIEEAREQQAQARNSKPGNKPGQKQAKPGEKMAQAQKPGAKPGQPKPNNGKSPAQDSKAPGAAAINTDLAKELAEKGAEWGAISPRLRDAIIDGSSENIIEEYRKLIEDYYKSLATKASER